ncbi:MAG: hypothetical protein V4692_10385 [Bdellovibrionota bacterium]
MMKSAHAKLWESAKASLEANIRETDEGPFLAAGSHQFGSLWTRDFCFAVPGLIAIDRRDVAENHLGMLIRTRRPEDQVIARIIECVSSARRVVTHTVFRFLPEFMKRIPMKSPLKVEHVGEHGTISIDSNAHVLRASAMVLRAGGHDWFKKNRDGLQGVLDFCLARTAGGTRLIEQGRFEDWQDSSAREGKTSYVNVLHAIAFSSAREMGLAIPTSALGFTDLVRNEFFDRLSGVYRAHTAIDLVSIDANLLLINELFDESSRIELYRSLKRHAIWTRAEIPGVSSYPDYPNDWISWTCKGVGLTHYHDRLLWTWLSGQAAKAAITCGDIAESDRIFSTLEKMSTRDGGVGEVYRPEPGVPIFENVLYRSELPFSWGSGCILEALKLNEKLNEQK